MAAASGWSGRDRTGGCGTGPARHGTDGPRSLQYGSESPNCDLPLTVKFARVFHEDVLRFLWFLAERMA
eukprot:744101-Hanusia_phi.AAC.1